MALKDILAAFPLAGLDRRFAFQSQRPYSTVDASNVLPSDPFLFRDRGGTRPGLTKYHADDWNSRFRTLGVFANGDGTRSLIGATLSGGVSYAPIGGASPSNGGGLNTDGRVQCFQFGQGIIFVGDTVHPTPVLVTYAAAGNVETIFDMIFTDDPSVDFPLSYPVAGAVKYNRLWLAYKGDGIGLGGRPNRFWASAVDLPLNMDDAADEEDPTTAYSAELNDTNDQITAIIPWYGDYLVMATGTSLYVLDGDPRAGGRMRRASGTLGIIDNSSWCYGENNSIIALSNSGPIMLSAGSPLSEPEVLMRDKLPGVLTSPDTTSYQYSIAFDSRSRRYYYFVTSYAGSTAGTHYAFDIANQSWWPMTFGSVNHEPFAVLTLREISSQRTDILLGCRDGYLRYFSEAATSDDGTALVSSVWLGPFRANSPRDDGIINEIVGTLAASSSSVTYTLHLGRNAEEAYAATAEWTGAWAAGRNYTDRPRLRCGTFYIKVAASSGRWAFEEALVRCVTGAQQRT